MVELLAQRFYLAQRQQERLAIVAHAFGIDIDDGIEPGECLFDMQEFVDLFLVLGHHNPGFRVVQHVLDLTVDGILIQGHRDGTQRFRCQQHPVQGRSVIANDRQPFSPLQA